VPAGVPRPTPRPPQPEGHLCVGDARSCGPGPGRRDELIALCIRQTGVREDTLRRQAALDVAVDLAGGLERRGPAADGPCAALVLARGEKADRVDSVRDSRCAILGFWRWSQE